MNKELPVGKPSLFLNGVAALFRLTGMQRGGRLVGLMPPWLLGAEIVWTDTDAGPLVVRVRDTGTRELLLFGRQLADVEETKIICALLPSARGVLDIGANYGWYTKFAANLMHPQSPKLALEANPQVATCLERSLHGLPGVRVLNVVATDRARQVRFYVAQGSGLSSAVRAVGEPTTIEGLPVDDIWPADQPLDFVKCDVEGGELDVLRGARRTRKIHEPIWMLEFDERFLAEAGVNPAEVADELSDMLCWWRSNENGWLRAENLGTIVGEPRTCQNVFLVPRRRATQFGYSIKRTVVDRQIQPPG